VAVDRGASPPLHHAWAHLFARPWPETTVSPIPRRCIAGPRVCGPLSETAY
jgi:hypothetical protein